MFDALMLNLWGRVFAWRNGERGQTMAEYAVVLAVIAIGVVLALTALSGAIGSALSTVTGNI